MASLLLEQTRAAHEDIERLERSIVADYHGNPRGHRDKLAQAHRVRRALDAIKRKAKWLVDEVHSDDADDGKRLRAEAEALRGGADARDFATAAGDADERVVSAALRAFDERLREARSYHARFRAGFGAGGDDDVTMDDELAAATAAARARALGGGLGGGGAAGAATGAASAAGFSSALDAAAAALAADASALPLFTGEEAGGRCLDLIEHHLSFVSAANGSSSSSFGRQDCDYSEFLSVLSDFDRLVVASDGRKGGGGGGRQRQRNHRRRRSRARSTAAWRRYLSSLLSYLEDFFERTQPLSSLSKVYKAAGAEPARAFEEKWEAGEVEGWRDRGLGNGDDGESESDDGGDDGDNDNASAPRLALPAPALDLSNFSSAKELEAVGPDGLRDALSALGLKAGGSVEQRASRLWLTRDAPLTSLDRKHFAKGSEVAAAVAAAAAAAAAKKEKKEKKRLALPAPGGDEEGNGNNGAPSPSSKKKGAAKQAQQQQALEASSRASALLELKVSSLLNGPLAAALEETRANVEKKAARTYEEAQADAEELEAEELGSGGGGAAAARGNGEATAAAAATYDTDSDEEDEHVRNPLRLPLGWDGKPIPYWLYKLHGLDKEFSCEICGGHSYRGRREFEMHFREARHATGMRALGIPNTKEFYEVTRIADAQALWETLRERRRGGGGGGGGGGAKSSSSLRGVSGSNAAVAADEMEEVEDEEGNVYDRRTYEDLKKQGIL